MTSSASMTAMGRKHWRYICGGGVVAGVAGVVWYRQTKAMLYSGLPIFLEKETLLAAAAAEKVAAHKAEAAEAAAAASNGSMAAWVPAWVGWSTTTPTEEFSSSSSDGGGAELLGVDSATAAIDSSPLNPDLLPLSTSSSSRGVATFIPSLVDVFNNNKNSKKKYLTSSKGPLTLSQAEELPGLEGYAHVTGFIDSAAAEDEQQQQVGVDSPWEMETDTFTNPVKLQDNGQIRVFRNKSKYCLDAEDIEGSSTSSSSTMCGNSSSNRGSTTAGKVPLLRIMGFFPDVTTDTMVRYLLLDPKLRLQWDPNQTNNDRLLDWESSGRHALDTSYTATTTPEHQQANIKSNGLFGEIVEDLNKMEVSSTQITYTLSSKVFEKLGVRARQVWMEVHRMVPRGFAQQDLFGIDNLPQMFLSRSIPMRFLEPQINHNGGEKNKLSETDAEKTTNAQRLAKIAQARLPMAAKELLRERSSRQPHEVFQHFQQIVLIPVEDSSQVHAVLEEYGTRGVTRSLPTVAQIRQLGVSTTSPSSASPFDSKGVIMIMTSVNDGKMAAMPRWIERQLGRYFGGLAQTSLLSGVEKNKDRVSDHHKISFQTERVNTPEED